MPDYKKELEDFTYIVSHDLSAPLRHIRAFGKLLIDELEDKVTDTEREYLQYIEDGINKTEMMIGALVEYSNLSAQDMNLECLNYSDLITEITKNFDHDVKEKNARISFHDLPDSLVGDRHMIERLLERLLDNALKFHRHDVDPVIKISAKPQDKIWLFSIADNGIGIAKEQCSNAFQIFRRLNTDQSAQGKGVSLTICKKIIERHNGEIWLESEEGKGTTVFFTLPSAP